MAIFNVEKSEITVTYTSPQGMEPVVNRSDIDLESLQPSSRKLIDAARLKTLTRLELKGGLWIYYSQRIFDQTGLEGAYVIPSIASEGRDGDWYFVRSDGYVSMHQNKPHNMAGLTVSRYTLIQNLISNEWYRKVNSELSVGIKSLLGIPYQIETGVGIEPLDEFGAKGPVLRYVQVQTEALVKVRE